MFDLHTHTSCSDGQYTPTELVRLAVNRGITHLAVTDHDTVSGQQEAAATAKEAGIHYLCGIEINTDRNHQHLLGFGISPASSALLTACEAFAERRTKRLEGFLRILDGMGIHFEMAEIRQYAKGQVGKPHLARAMVAAGYAESVEDAFARYLKQPAFKAAEQPKPTIAQAIALVHEAGGAAVLAHPYELRLPDAELSAYLDTLLPLGLDGIEVYYQSYTEAQFAFLRGYAQVHGLLMTGGSDFHGEAVKPRVTLGMPDVPDLFTQEKLHFL